MIRKLFALLDGSAAFPLTIVAHVGAGILQGVALGLLVPFLSAFLAGSDVPTWLISALVISILGSGSLSLIGSLIGFRVAAYDLCGTLVRKVGLRVQELPLGWFDRTSVGKVTTATSTSVGLLSHIPSIVIPELASTGGAAAALLVLAWVYEWRIALALTLSVPVAVIALRMLRRAVVSEHRAEEEAMEVLSSRIIEFAQLQPVLRASDSVHDGWAPLEEALTCEHKTTDRAGAAKGRSASLFHAGVQISILLSLAVAIFLVLGGELSAPVFIALSLMAVRFAEPIGMIAFYVDPLHQAEVALDLITDIVDSPVLPEPSVKGARVPTAPFDSEAQEVSFSYVSGRPVIDTVDFLVSAGSVTALVGPSGSGKSTLLRLFARFWDADSGRVSLGGVDVRDMRVSSLMDAVSLVFQDVYLFDTSIAENVRLGKPSASDEEVALAARRAGLDEVVARLPHGWQTRVGEGGSSLSGGERQRVAIARAFLKDSPVLLLDEVTSALDGINEASVTRALSELSEGKTVLVIAHRLSTIRRADRIVVLRDGVVESVGTHEELYAAGGTYTQFWEDQSSVERWRLSGSC